MVTKTAGYRPVFLHEINVGCVTQPLIINPDSDMLVRKGRIDRRIRGCQRYNYENLKSLSQVAPAGANGTARFLKTINYSFKNCTNLVSP